MKWMDKTVLMKDIAFWDESNAISEALTENDSEFNNILDSHAVEIKEAKNKKMNTDKVIENQKDLTESKKEDLTKLLNKYTKLFDGTLGRYPHKKVHLEVDPNATPIHKRLYAVAHAHHEFFKTELDHLVKIGVLGPCGATEWAAPTFIIPKIDGRVCWVSGFCDLNKVLKRQIYPLPRIQEILTKRPFYRHFTKLDISMQYYTLKLDDKSKDHCKMVTPFGKHQCC
jgi:hypothetical protein